MQPLLRVTTLLCVAFSAASLSAAAWADPLKIVATIKPIHSLTAAVVEGVAEPKLLLQGAASPHTYALKPSDARDLSEADVIIRVSENLEVFLDRALQALPKHARVIDLDRAPGLMLLPVRQSATYEAHSHGENAEESQAHSHSGGFDVHFWLDPSQAMKIADYLANEFSTIDPGNAAKFRENAAKLKSKLAALDEELKASLSPLSGRPFIVFHDVTQYLERRYGLNSVASVTLGPERQPGTARLEAIRSTIERLDAVCIFSEPQFPPKLIESLAEGTRAKRGVFDEIGAGIPPGPEHYFAFIRKNAAELAQCLGSGQKAASAPVK